MGGDLVTRLPGFARVRVADPVKDKVKSRAEPPKLVLEVRYAGKSLFALNIYDDAQGTAQPADSCTCPPLTRHASPGDDTGAVDTDVVLPPEAPVVLAEVLGAGREGAAAEDVVDAALRPSDNLRATRRPQTSSTKMRRRTQPARPLRQTRLPRLRRRTRLTLPHRLPLGAWDGQEPAILHRRQPPQGARCALYQCGATAARWLTPRAADCEAAGASARRSPEKADMAAPTLVGLFRRCETMGATTAPAEVTTWDEKHVDGAKAATR